MAYTISTAAATTYPSYSTIPVMLPTYTPKIGEICVDSSDKVDMSQFPTDRWLIHKFEEIYFPNGYHLSASHINYVDNFGALYTIGCTGPSNTQTLIQHYKAEDGKELWAGKYPLSDTGIASVKRLGIRPMVGDRIYISLVWPEITYNFLQPFREVARLEYILHQRLTATPSIKPLESAIRHLSTDIDAEKAERRTLHRSLETAIHRLTADLEAEKAKNKMLEARLSVLEAFLAPKPVTVTPPPTEDLLGLTTPTISPLTGAVIEAEDTPQLIVTDATS